MQLTQDQLITLRLMADDETSLSALTEHDWHVLMGQWHRGIDWCVHKLGRKWSISEAFGKRWPLYRTKSAAYDAVSALVLRESHRRSAVRTLAEIGARA